MQIVDVPPAIMADKMCVTQCCLSEEPLRGLVIIILHFLGGEVYEFLKVVGPACEN